MRDPSGMVGDTLGVDMHVLTGDAAPLRNLELCINRSHLSVERMVATPYASALAALVDDEAEMGAACIDMGGGTTTISCSPTASSSSPIRSPSAATTSPWTSRAASRPGSRMPSG